MRKLLLAFLCASPLAAFAGDENPGSVLAVQRRQYRMVHELKAGAGVLPLDAFYKSVTGNVSYTYHFNDHFAWQVGRASVARNFGTGLRKQLERDFGVLTTDFEEVQWIAGSDLVWSPLYGKTAFMNRAVLHLEFFILAGGSGVKTQTEVQPGAHIAAGVRFFGTERVSLRVEAANHFTLGKKKFNIVDIQASLAFNFGSLE